jgi:hypothetical protein
MQAVPECDRLADPVAERCVIRASQDSVNGQPIRGSTHAVSIPDQLRPSRRNSRLLSQITIYGWSIRRRIRAATVRCVSPALVRIPGQRKAAGKDAPAADGTGGSGYAGRPSGLLAADQGADDAVGPGRARQANHHY